MEILGRKILPNINTALKLSPIVFLNGARQAGKSTLVQQLAADRTGAGEKIIYLSFDRPAMMAAAAAEPEAFLSAYPHPVIIDEVQMVPELFRPLKIAADELRRTDKKNANGRYLLTGSANIMALPALADALVGRMSVLTLYPFCTAETIGAAGDGLDRLFRMDFSGLESKGLSLSEAMELATFPELIDQTAEERAIWFDGYITTILQRDVKMIAELEKISILPHMLRILASRAGSLINDSDIARETGLNSVTGKTYRNILKMMFLTFDVPPWHKNIGKRLVKSSKGYISDTALLCHMLDLNLSQMAQTKPALFGHVLENYVATELIKQLSFSTTRAGLYHFRTSDGKEVDFVLEKPDGRILGIEIKRTELVTTGDFSGLRFLQSATGDDFAGGIVLYSGKEVVPFGKNLWAVPFNILWQ